MDWNSFWGGVGSFIETYGLPLRIAVIIVVALIIRWILHFVVRGAVERIVSGVKVKQHVTDTRALNATPLAAVRTVQRARTVGTVLNNLVTWTIVVIAAAMILDALGISIAAIIASAGVVAAGLAFGAQSLVKDVLSGLFMVMEDQLGVGDIVDLGEASGVVENVGIRVTQVRDVVGTLWFVRNGEILRVGNMSQGWARALIDLPIPYTADVELAKRTMLATANELAEDPDYSAVIMEAPEIWGIESLSSQAVVVRLVVKTRPSEQWGIARELRLRLKKALEDVGIRVPPLERVIIDGADDPRVAAEIGKAGG